MTPTSQANDPVDPERQRVINGCSSGGRVLLVEDDADIASLVRIHLEDANYEVTVVTGGRAGLDAAIQDQTDLLILDLSLPDVDGLDICRQLTRRERRPLILMLTARGTELDRVRGLELGADDYLTKPFSILELTARVRALFRRPPVRYSTALDDNHVFVVGGLSLDSWQRCAHIAGIRIALTAREFDLLLWFVRHPNRIFSRADLLDAVWGTGYDGYEHTVNSHLNRLRSKLERDASHPSLLITVRGGGYKLVPPGGSPLAVGTA
jgi:DNA-binding response OmpR family regulator